MSDDAVGFTNTPLIAGPCPVTITPIITLKGANTFEIELSFLINTYPTTQIHYALGSAGLFSRFLKTSGEQGSPSTVERFNGINSGPDIPIAPDPTIQNGSVTGMAVRSPLNQTRNGQALRKVPGSQNAIISVNGVGPVGDTFYPLDLIVYYGSTYSYLRVLLKNN